MTDSIEDKTELLHSLQEKLPVLEALVRRANGAIDDAVIAGIDPSELREERDALEAEARDLARVIPRLAAEVETAKEESLHARAVERVHEIHRSLSGNAGEQPARLGRFLDAALRYQETGGKLVGAYLTQRSLLAEEAALRARFSDLPLTEPKLIEMLPGREPLVEEAIAAVRAAVFPMVPSHLPRATMPSTSPGAKLIAEAGPTDAERRDHDEQERARLEREEKERRMVEGDSIVAAAVAQAHAVPSGFRA